MVPAWVGGSSSLIRWLSRKPLRDSSAPSVKTQAPDALPMAFQVQTVPGSTARENRHIQRTLPWGDSSQIQSPSSKPLAAPPGVHEQIVVAMDLARPGVLAVPGVVHGHGPLGQGVQRIAMGIRQPSLQGLVIEGQRVEEASIRLTQRIRGAATGALALGGAPEALQDLRVDIEQ